MIGAKAQALIRQCDKHLSRLHHAYAKMAAFMPLDADQYARLSDDEVEHVDQYLFRFAQLQDATGDKLFTLLLEHFKEEAVKSRPFIDILNRLEQLGVLEDKNAWFRLRKIRNDISHQYDDEPQAAADALNAMYAAKTVLEKIYLDVKRRFHDG